MGPLTFKGREGGRIGAELHALSQLQQGIDKSAIVGAEIPMAGRPASVDGARRKLSAVMVGAENRATIRRGSPGALATETRLKAAPLASRAFSSSAAAQITGTDIASASPGGTNNATRSASFACAWVSPSAGAAPTSLRRSRRSLFFFAHGLLCASFSTPADADGSNLPGQYMTVARRRAEFQAWGEMRYPFSAPSVLLPDDDR
jgi:hypothetical protein